MKKIIQILLIFIFSVTITKGQWYTQQSGVTNHLYDIEFINKNTGWVCGTGGTILKTTNGGVIWTQQITNVPTKPLFGIHPVNENVVYSVGWFGTILKTTNGGDNWVAIENGVVGDGNYFCVFFLNEELGWIGENIMSHGEVKKTTDGGMTFTSSYTFGWPYDLHFKDSLNGVGVDGAATIHRTTNGGNSWTSFAIAGSGDFYRVSFINQNTGFVIGGGTEILYKTTNFGQNWNSISFIPNMTGYSTSIEFLSDSVGWVGGTNGIYKTIDGGKNWILQIATGVIYTITAINDSLVWACSNLGRIWHTANGGTKINQISEDVPVSFELLQNYPNPFNSSTNIKFRIRTIGVYKMNIYNNLGRHITKVFDDKLTQGIYEINYNAEELSSGIYYYSLIGVNNKITKKFILLK